ncbi:MAG: family 20 glycosylhydrolase, partial [Candidatus Sumerlaeota bacterium]
MRNFKIKGIMIDSARVMEQRHVYSEMLRLFADWGYNTLFWHFCDDQGCRLRFPSRPELGSFNAWSAHETREFID